VIAVVAALSMVLGNLTAIVQSSVKRLLAYSAIAHAGYMLLGVLANTPSSRSALLFYVITYALTVLGAFGVVTVVEAATGGDAISNFAGLSRRAPDCRCACWCSCFRWPAFLRWQVHRKIFPVQRGGGGGRRTSRPALAVVLAIVMSAVSFYYYLQVLKQAWVLDAAENAPAIKVPPVTMVALVLLAVLVILLGCCPGLLLRHL